MAKRAGKKKAGKKKIDHENQTFVPGTEPPGWDKEIHRLARKYLIKAAEAKAASLLADDAEEACFEEIKRKGLQGYKCGGITVTRKLSKESITIKGTKEAAAPTEPAKPAAPDAA